MTGQATAPVDGDQRPVGEVVVGALGDAGAAPVVRKLDAAERLVPPVAGAGEGVHRVAAVEVRRPVHRVVVLGAVRVEALHLRDRVLQVDREGAVRGRRGRDAGVGRGVEDPLAVVPDLQRLVRRALGGQRVAVAVGVGLALGDRVQQVRPDLRAGVAVHGEAHVVLERADRPADQDVVRPDGPLAGQRAGVAGVEGERARGRVVGRGELGVRVGAAIVPVDGSLGVQVSGR